MHTLISQGKSYLAHETVPRCAASRLRLCGSPARDSTVLNLKVKYSAVLKPAFGHYTRPKATKCLSHSFHILFLGRINPE